MPDHKPQDHGPVYIHEDEMDWETLRFPGQHSMMVLHPSPDDPTHPNAGFHIPGVPEYLWRIRPVGSPVQERCGCIMYWQAREISRIAAAPDFPFDPELIARISPIE